MYAQAPPQQQQQQQRAYPPPTMAMAMAPPPMPVPASMPVPMHAWAAAPQQQHVQMPMMQMPMAPPPGMGMGPTTTTTTMGADAKRARGPARIGSRLAPELENKLKDFWADVTAEQRALPLDQNFKVHSELPLARVKRVMKTDRDVRMVSSETPMVFARACHLFIRELTARSWFEACADRRTTMQRRDVDEAIFKCDHFDFLVDVANGVIKEEEEELKRERAARAAAAAAAAASSSGAAGGGGGSSSSSGPLPSLGEDMVVPDPSVFSPGDDADAPPPQ